MIALLRTMGLVATLSFMVTTYLFTVGEGYVHININKVI
jgi:hypothetical protein